MTYIGRLMSDVSTPPYREYAATHNIHSYSLIPYWTYEEIQRRIEINSIERSENASFCSFIGGVVECKCFCSNLSCDSLFSDEDGL